MMNSDLIVGGKSREVECAVHLRPVTMAWFGESFSYGNENSSNGSKYRTTKAATTHPRSGHLIQSSDCYRRHSKVDYQGSLSRTKFYLPQRKHV